MPTFATACGEPISGHEPRQEGILIMATKAHHMERAKHFEGEAKRHREMARRAEPKKEMRREDKKEDAKRKREKK